MNFIKSLKLKFIGVFAILVVLPFFSNAQESDFGNWMIYIGNKKLNSKWNIHNEIQYRNYNAIGDLEQLLIRVGLGYNLTENNNNVLLGYGYILSDNYIDNSSDKVSVNEQRVYQQFATKQNVGKLILSHRYRFEQRFIESNFKMRFRYFLSLNYPLKTFKESNSLLYATAYNEIFLNTESPVFDRNRLFGGLGWKLNNKLKFEIGYMNQFFENSERDQINLIMYFNF